MRIWVVDDHAVVRSALGHLLAAQSDIETVTEAENGQAALQLLSGGLPVDIIVTDVQMPVMDGFELTRKAMALRPDVAVIVLTSLPRETTCHKAIAAGADDCLSKESDFDELTSAIRKAYAKQHPSLT